jgi:hypothetical protein
MELTPVMRSCSVTLLLAALRLLSAVPDTGCAGGLQLLSSARSQKNTLSVSRSWAGFRDECQSGKSGAKPAAIPLSWEGGMRQTSKIVAEAITVGMLLAVGAGHCFAQIATPGTLAPAIKQATNVNATNLEAATPDAPSAVFAANVEFSSSKSQDLASILGVVGSPDPILGFLPRTAPVSAQERFHRFLHRSFSPEALRGDLWDAAQAQFHGAWPGYGGGVIGFEKRYFAVLASHTTSNFFGGYMFPTLLHQNPRSPRLGPGHSFWHRFGYAATRVAVTRNDYGKETFNSSLLLTMAASRSVANLYFPREQRGFSASISSVQGALIDTVQGNLQREFVPDIQHFLWKHAPGCLKRMADRLPYARF